MVDVQKVRLLDVFVIAPFLMYAGSRKELSKPVRIGLWAVGGRHTLVQWLQLP